MKLRVVYRKDEYRRVQRGGNWNDYASFLRAARRYYDGPSSQNSYIGARLSRSLKKKLRRTEMVDYNAKSRTSYVKVKSKSDFEKWANSIPDATVITKEAEEGGQLCGLLFGAAIGSYGGVPQVLKNGETFNIYAEMQKHVANGWSVVFEEVGYESHRYLVGRTVIVTPTRIVRTDLREWASNQLEQLGMRHTKPEW